MQAKNSPTLPSRFLSVVEGPGNYRFQALTVLRYDSAASHPRFLSAVEGPGVYRFQALTVLHYGKLIRNPVLNYLTLNPSPATGEGLMINIFSLDFSCLCTFRHYLMKQGINGNLIVNLRYFHATFTSDILSNLTIEVPEVTCPSREAGKEREFTEFRH